MKMQEETKSPEESAPFVLSEDSSFDAFLEVETGESSSSRTIDSGSQTVEEESELSLLSRILKVKVTKMQLLNLENHPFLKSCIRNVSAMHVLVHRTQL